MHPLCTALLLAAANSAYAPTVSGRQYAVIFDGGSTGTRVHVFSWSHGDRGTVDGLPDVRAEPGGNLKVKPGISSFEGSPDDAGSSITPLLELAERVVPKSEHAHALVMLRATAGMRLLPRRRAQRIYTSLFEAVERRGTFKPHRQHFGTLSGEEEGVFGWLCANYLLRRSGQIREMGGVGALDLGGGSTQITLAAPHGVAHSSEIDPRHGVERHHATAAAALKVALPSGSVHVFTHSHLGFGNKAVLSALTQREAEACLAAGVNSSWEPCNKSADYQRYLAAGAEPFMLTGRGDFAGCDAAVRRFIATTFDRAGQPALAPLTESKLPTHFVAMSLFFYAEHFAEIAGHLKHTTSGDTTSPIRASSGPAASSIGAGGVSASELRDAAKGLCELDDGHLRSLVGLDPLTTEDALRWRCFDLTYAARLLTDGYGFDEHAAVIDFKGDIDGVEVEWTLGALLNQLLDDADGAGRPGSDGRSTSQHVRQGNRGLRGGVGIGSYSWLEAIGFMLCVCGVLALGRRHCQLRNQTRASRSRLLQKW